jgi:hypothetical protein
MQAGSKLNGGLGTATRWVDRATVGEALGRILEMKHTARGCSAEGWCRRKGRSVWKSPLNGDVLPENGTKDQGSPRVYWVSYIEPDLRVERCRNETIPWAAT